MVEGAEVPDCIDEIPALAVAAAAAEGTTEFRDAAELRVKESDRIATTSAGLAALGVEVETSPAGLAVHGSAPAAWHGGRVESHGDHRIAMAFAVAARLAAPRSSSTASTPSRPAGRDSSPTWKGSGERWRAAGAPGAWRRADRDPWQERRAGRGAAMTTVAIDGPGGAGKSTVAGVLAERLGLARLDTGAMYRAVTLLALRNGTDPADGAALASLAREMELSLGERVLLDGEDVTAEIRLLRT